MNEISQPIDVLNQQELKVVKLLLDSDVIHYSDIEKSIGRSRKTITKYLDEIEEVLSEYLIDLVRKRNVGIYLEGNTSELSNVFQNEYYSDLPKTKEERVVSILSKLLLSNDAQTIQDLADRAFVSRSTLESDFKEVKQLLARYDAFIETTHEGIKIVASESAKRKLMSELLTMYWGNTMYTRNEKGEIHSKLQLPTEMQSFFSKEVFKKVLESLDEFEELGNLKFSDYEFQSLAIHLIISMERITKDETLEKGEESEKLEENTISLIEILEKKFKVKIPEYEQQYINIHILAAEGKTFDQGNISESKTPFKEVTISDYLRKVLKHYDDILINGLTVHLSSALKRLYLGLSLHNPYTDDIKRYFPRAYNESIDISSAIEQKFNITLNEDEVAYIALHIEAFLERKKSMVNVAIVCSTGLGTARLLEQRVKKFFPESIHITRVTSIQALKHNPISEDLVISTINFDVPNIPVVIVPPFLDPNSVNRIRSVTKNILSNRHDSNSFGRLLNSKLVFVSKGREQRDDVIKKISRKLITLKYCKDDIGDAAINRENLASTSMDNIAMPHAPVKYVIKPCISIYVNQDGIDWDGHEVNLVFFITINHEVQDEVEQIYKYFNDVLENKPLLKRVINSTSVDEILKLLGGDFIE
ncbi:BglG family transcription antiterminator [Companilactobacillus hulinensis]|uniref:BglG family transcription antiterminator n=1 Tax=Companilactobacillus hulinensis TaxID=2486007 RepID=UPI0013DD91BB|nr:BglG family transcription antiterminator [Companilactobacillus hulinensis]